MKILKKIKWLIKYKNFVKSLKSIPKFDVLRLELTNICGYKCNICPRDKMKRKQGYTTFEDIDIVVKRLGKNAKNIKSIELHGHGDPLLVDNLIEKINYLKTIFKNAKISFITTLGYEKSYEFFESLIKSELTDLRVSFYGGNKENYKKIHGVDNFELVYKNLTNIININNKLNNKINIVIHLFYGDKIPNTDIVLPNNGDLMRDIKNNLEIMSPKIIFGELILHNYGNGRKYKEQEREKVCSVGFVDARRFLQISYGLNVIPCSMAYDDEVIFGNLKEQSLDEIFTSEYYKKFQKSLLTNNLSDYSCCINCNKFSSGNNKYIEYMKYYLEHEA